MKKINRVTALLLSVIIFAVCLAMPAHAEGFAFNWDQDSENTTGPHCKSIFLLNLDTDTVAYSLNPDEELPMASMTKIMSYIVAYETIPDIENTVITVPQSVQDELEGTGSSLAGVTVGEELTGLQLLYLMMVPSGNDAALTLAKYVDSLYEQGKLEGTFVPDISPNVELDENGIPVVDEHGKTDYAAESYFVQLMNEKAKELGCTHTHYTNAHGLHNDNHYTTAREMAEVTKYAMTLPHFTEITGTGAYVKPVTNMSDEQEVKYTTNKMLSNTVDGDTGISYYHQFTTGIKTGSHNEAGHCLAASATAYGYTYIAVLMGDMEGYESGIHYEMLDARSLFRWSLSELEKKTVAVQGDVMSSVGLKYAWQQDELLLVAGENASVMLPSSVDSNSILVSVDIPESVEAPIRKGEQIGTATLSYAGETVATVPLVAAESIAKSEALQVWEQGQAVLTAPWFLVIMAVIAALIIVYIILIMMYRKKQRQLRKVRRFRDM